MTLENLKIHHKRLKWLASGEFTERDFDYTIKASENPHGKKGEAGRMAMGDFSTARRNLIQQDAQRTLNLFEKKYPDFKVGETPPEFEEPKTLTSEPKLKTKPKEKK